MRLYSRHGSTSRPRHFARTMRTGQAWRAPSRKACAPSGCGQARYLGLAKTHLQELGSATALNLTRWSAWHRQKLEPRHARSISLPWLTSLKSTSPAVSAATVTILTRKYALSTLQHSNVCSNLFLAGELTKICNTTCYN